MQAWNNYNTRMSGELIPNNNEACGEIDLSLTRNNQRTVAHIERSFGGALVSELDLQGIRFRIDDLNGVSLPGRYMNPLLSDIAGVAFINFFPITDFNALGVRVEEEIKSTQTTVNTLRRRQLLQRIKGFVFGPAETEEISIQFGLGGVSITRPEDVLRQQSEYLEIATEEAQKLNDRIVKARKTGLDHVIYMRGYNIARRGAGNTSQTDLVIQGTRGYTEKLVDTICTDPRQFSSTVFDLFAEHNGGVEHYSFNPRSIPYVVGEKFNPFANIREIKFTDFRTRQV